MFSKFLHLTGFVSVPLTVFFCIFYIYFFFIPQLTDDVKKEKEKEPEKEKEAPTMLKKKGFEEEAKDSDDSDDVSIHLSYVFLIPWLG